jgi:predicted permease
MSSEQNDPKVTQDGPMQRSGGFSGWMDSTLKDLRFAIRTLRRNPGFTLIIVLTLAFGIGANAAMFTVLDQVLLRSLPVKNPSQIVLLRMRGRHYGSNWGTSAISYPMYRDFQANNQVFSGMCARFPIAVGVASGGQSNRVDIELVSGTYFPVMGVGAALGRVFDPNDDTVPNGSPIAVLNYDYWKQAFGGDPQIVGKTLLVNGHQYQIVGVAEQGFSGTQLGYSAKAFVPISMANQIIIGTDDFLTNRRQRWVNAFGRLKPGVSLQQAQASLQPFMHAMLEMEVKEAAFAHASENDRTQFLKCWIQVLPGSQGQAYEETVLSAPLWVLMCATGVVLLIACANIANLLLARATGRQKEIAMRLAIGASRGRLIKQLLVETLALSALGAIAGLGVAYLAVRALVALYMPQDAQGLKIGLTPDARILLFFVAVTVLTGILFGLVPAIQSTKPDIGKTLKDEAGAVVGGHAGMRKALVVAQVALSFLLVLGAGLFLRTLNNLLNMGPGFPVDHLIGLNVDPTIDGYTPERTKIFYNQLLQTLGAVPGVRSVGLASVRILDNNEWDSGVTVEPSGPGKGVQTAEPYMNMISPNYFAALGVPIVAGRDFTMQDTREVHHRPEEKEGGYAPATIMVNERFAQKYFGNENPIGHHIGFGTDPGTPTDMEIIGVVKDIRYTNLRDEIPEQAFEPYMASRGVGSGSMTVYVRTALDPAQLMPVIREKIREMDSTLPVYDMRTMDEQLSLSLVTERMIASLSSVFGIFATLLAAIGLYGVMAYTVARRTREIGIRMALGAERGTVIWLVMRDVLLLVSIGIAIGVPASVALTRYARSQLYGVQPNDPSTLILAIAALAAVAGIAGLVPAMRASRLDPMIALRHE